MEYLDIYAIQYHWIKFAQACHEGAKIVQKNGMTKSEFEVHFDLDFKKYVNFVFTRNKGLLHNDLRAILIDTIQSNCKLLCHCCGTEKRYETEREVPSLDCAIAIALADSLFKTHDCWIKLSEDKRVLQIVGHGYELEPTVLYEFMCFEKENDEELNKNKPLTFEIA